MTIMRKLICLLIILFALCVQTTASAADVHYFIKGVNPASLKNILARLKSANLSLSNKSSRSQIDRFAYNRIPKEVQTALEPYGYFQSQTHITHTHYQEPYAISFTVTPGPAVKIASVDFQILGPGSKTKAFLRLKKYFPLKVGQQLNTAKYEQTKNRLFDLAANRGYFKAKLLQNEVKINLINHQAKIILHFNTGPRYKFGITTFSNHKFSQTFYNRFIPYHQGQYYSARQIQKLQTNLGSSGYFKQVVVTPEPGKSEHYVIPVLVTTEPQDSQQYTFGIGYGTDSGVRGLMAVNFRRIGSNGQHADAIIRASQKIAQNISLNYYIPGKDPVTSQYVISGIAENFDQKDIANGQQYKLRGRYDTIVYGWNQTFALNVLKENFQLEGEPRRKSLITYPSMNWSRIYADNTVDPNRGVSVNLNMSGAVKNALSEKSYFRILGSVRGLYTIHNDWRLVGRAKLGRITTKDLPTLPYSLQFYIGGAESLRGFGYNAIGPGENLFLGSVELQRRITGNWYGELFYDIGNVANKSFGKMNEGAGPGIVWRSPIGAFELTWAKVISQKSGPTRIQFSFGTDL